MVREIMLNLYWEEGTKRNLPKGTAQLQAIYGNHENALRVAV
jgi:hypothetical protein